MSTAIERRWYEAVASLESCVLCGVYGVQICHSNRDRGMGQKSKPWLTAALCPPCHQEVDNGRDMTQEQRRAQMDRAIVLTHDALARSGRLTIK